MKKLIVIILCGFSFAYAAINPVEFETQEQTERYQKLIAELRCLVCQNQNLADSNADLAVDLKNIVIEKIQAGESDQQILDFMTARYGDFVLYKPPLKSSTWLLWLGPSAFLIIGLVILVVYVRRSKNSSSNLQPTPQQREQIRKMLDNE